jgi:chromosome segregation ATPase
MPEWVAHIITAITSAGVLAAVFKGWSLLAKTRGEQRRADRGEDRKSRAEEAESELRCHAADVEARRQARADEIGVLHGVIDGLKQDIVAVQGKADKQEVELRNVKDEHTTCLIEQERLRADHAVLRERQDAMKRELRQLRRERGRERDGGGDAGTDTGG